MRYSFATPDDVPQVVALVESAYRGESSRVGWTTEADLLDGQRIDAAMVVETLARPGAHLLLARRDGGLVACCELQRPSAADPTPKSSDTSTQPEQQDDDPPHGCSPDGARPGAAYFGMFSVDPAQQGAGVGRNVLAEAERIARDEWSADALELTVIDRRSELIAWYERRGYTRTGEHRPFPYGDARFGIPKRDDLRLAVLCKAL